MKTALRYGILLFTAAGCGDPVRSFCEALDQCEQSPLLPHVSTEVCEARLNAWLDSKPTYVAECYRDHLDECSLKASCAADCPNRGDTCE